MVSNLSLNTIAGIYYMYINKYMFNKILCVLVCHLNDQISIEISQ